MAAEDCSKVALEAGLKKSKVYVKDQETDVSLLSVLLTVELKLQRLSMLLQCLTMDVVLQRDVEFNNIFKYN
jgi:hypothetical protein